jgi:hypothetical protein
VGGVSKPYFKIVTEIKELYCVKQEKRGCLDVLPMHLFFETGYRTFMEIMV